MTTLLNRTYDTRDELALIRSEPISMQWTKELRRSIGLHPGCKLLRGLLTLDLNTRTVVYPLLIKGWSSRQIARSSKGFPYHDSQAIGNRPTAAAEQSGGSRSGSLSPGSLLGLA